MKQVKALVLITVLSLSNFGFAGENNQQQAGENNQQQQEPIVVENPLVTSVLMQNQANLEALIADGADANFRLADGRTIFQFAAQVNNLNAVRALAEAGADLNAGCPEERNRTALAEASFTGNLELVNLLIELGADVNSTNSQNAITAIFWACMADSLEIVQALVEADADLNATAADYTVLQLAQAEHKQHIVNYLEEQLVAVPPHHAEAPTLNPEAELEEGKG